MKRYILTDADRKKALEVRGHNIEGRDARTARRKAELALLDRLRAELAMPEWYPER